MSSIYTLVVMLTFILRLSSPVFSQSCVAPSGATCRIMPGSKQTIRASSSSREPKNVLGGVLETCCRDPLTGYYRDGSCRTGESDRGVHTVCAMVTQEFLEYSKSRGNDLMTPSRGNRFPGLKEGDKWCLCVSRWMEAERVGKAPPIVLKSTHEKSLRYVELETLKKYAVDADAVEV